MEIIDYDGADFKAVKSFEGWKIGILRYSERFSAFDRLEKHIKTDEVFVLLCGTATLYTENESFEMEASKLYSVAKGEWHHITVSPEAKVLVIENSNTSEENTVKRML